MRKTSLKCFASYLFLFYLFYVSISFYLFAVRFALHELFFFRKSYSWILWYHCRYRKFLFREGFTYYLIMTILNPIFHVLQWSKKRDRSLYIYLVYDDKQKHKEDIKLCKYRRKLFPLVLQLPTLDRYTRYTLLLPWGNLKEVIM